MVMAKGYWIARVDVSDPQQYQAYVAANAEPFRQYGARFLVRAGPFEAVEGESRSRNVVIEFPSYAQAMECWHSPGYSQARALRLPAASGEVVIVEGYDGPQPA
jgi:uncharacterized protein (DUF1330 family)